MANNNVLYTWPYSICSTMVRYTFANRGVPKDTKDEMSIEERQINIMTGEQLSEHYLCEVNANGEVPVVITPNAQPIPESVEITKYFAKSYPSLIPAVHAEEISRLLSDLHNINFFSLTFAGKPQGQHAALAKLNEKLKEDISGRYRTAIDTKIKRINSYKLSALEDDFSAQNEKRVKSFLEEVKQMLQQSQTEWLLSTEHPTAIDAHTIVFLARLIDIHRDDLIPAKLRTYAENAMKLPEWETVMQGRRTMPSK